MFACLGADLYAQQATTEENSTKELNGLLDNTVKAEASDVTGVGDESAPTDREIRELSAEEDPLSSSEIQRDASREEGERKGEDRAPAFGFDLYGSLRVRYRGQGSDGAWEDGSSRLGIEVERRFPEKSYLFARYEAGFNLLDALDSDKSAEEFKDTIFTRLGHVGLETPSTQIIAGKNWSTYYEVGAFTDRFMGAGGDASGVFNAQTDGGSTGTGRADRTLQTNLSLDFLTHRVFKPFKLNAQVQHGNAIPFGGDAHYGTAIGISSVVTTESDFTLGVAYNHSEVDLDDNPSLRDVGLSGDARSLLIGTRAVGERWYAGIVLAKMKNHETTDEGIYFDGWGSELYGQYQISDRIWFVGGYNILEPDSDQAQAGDYRIRYLITGLRYSFDDFRRMIYANVRINDGLDADGTQAANVYTIGIRWDLTSRGWHPSN